MSCYCIHIGVVKLGGRFCASRKGGTGEVDGFRHGVLCTW